MACIKNPKKFLFFRWNGKHKKKIEYICRFGVCSWAKYECDFKCEACGVNLGDIILSEETLLEYGFNPEKLQKIGSREFFSRKAEDLK